MSGIFGILDSRRGSSINRLLTLMGDTMSHYEWYAVETHSNEKAGVGLGRIGIGIFNQAQQPICSEDGNLMIFLSGEFYETTELRHGLTAEGHHFRNNSDSELVLRLYQEKGEQFIHDLEGVFVLAIWNRKQQEIIIANDRFGFHPLYYACYKDKITFAPEMKGILCDPDFPNKLNMIAAAEYIRFQQLLGEKTFSEGVTLLPPASMLRINSETLQLTRQNYWDWRSIQPFDKRLTKRELAEESERIFRRAVNIRLEKARRPGIFLTGGLDSRAILAVANPQDQPITTISYGHRDSRDAYLAARIARAAGTQHQLFELKNGDWVKEVVDLHLELTEGAHSWIHSHGISILPQARALIDVNLSGFGGGRVMGSVGERPSIIFAPDEEAFINNMIHFYTQQHTWPGLTEAEAQSLFTNRHNSVLALDSLRAELSQFAHPDKRLRSMFFNITNLDRRLYFNFVLFKNSHFENRCPFYDYQLVEWLARLPTEQKTGKQIQRSIISRAAPRLALIPYDKTYRLPTTNRLLWGLHAMYTRTVNVLGKRLKIGSPRSTLYADYENYLRYELREWAEAILFDERTLARGIFRPEALRSLMNRHLAGHEEWTIGKIAPIITLEMVLRRYFD